MACSMMFISIWLPESTIQREAGRSHVGKSISFELTKWLDVSQHVPATHHACEFALDVASFSHGRYSQEAGHESSTGADGKFNSEAVRTMRELLFKKMLVKACLCCSCWKGLAPEVAPSRACAT